MRKLYHRLKLRYYKSRERNARLAAREIHVLQMEQAARSSREIMEAQRKAEGYLRKANAERVWIGILE